MIKLYDLQFPDTIIGKFNLVDVQEIKAIKLKDDFLHIYYSKEGVVYNFAVFDTDARDIYLVEENEIEQKEVTGSLVSLIGAKPSNISITF